MENDIQYVFLTAGTETKFRILHGIDRPINSMTVGKICENCHISRPTFYAHFDSKYSIPFWLFDLASDLYLVQIGRTITWDRGIHGFFSFLYGERAHLQNAFIDNPDRMEVESRLQGRRNKIIETLRSYKNLEPDDTLLFFVEHFVNCGNLLATEWCIKGMKTDPATFAKLFTACMPAELINVLNQGLPVRTGKA